MSKDSRTAIPEARKQFEQVIGEVIDRLPERFREAIRNLSVIVEDEPKGDLLSELEQDPDEPLLGLYIGTPLPERIFGEEPILPDQILIFRGPLERMCADGGELREQIRITILHELAHYFGIEDEELEEMGWD